MSKLIVCAGKIESFEFATPIGIGLIESAINLTNILAVSKQTNVSEVIFVGTGGLYRDGEILEIYESKLAVQHEISELENNSYSPIFAEICPDVSRETSVINSSNFITTNKELANKFANLGYFLENMEFYSVYRTCQFFEIPCSAIICATNFCDENAHKEFIKNHNAAKEKLEIYLKSKGLI
ncbi:MAG: purine-nucleoside phosphorylase [Campylobacteraceae bacterium]|nr:purine-nucleoside phosphorylase [Campylobacteraceae bacterium]